MDIISGAINQTNQQITIAQGGFNASWELDIFGHNRMNVKAASLRRDSAMMNVSAVYNSVLGDLFQAVIQWKSSFRKMQILKNLLKVQTELIQILQYQAKNGFSDFIIANQAISQKSLFESQLRLVESLYKSSQNQIERLVNKQFNELNSLFDENKCTEIFVPKLKNVLNVKMRTVENRPDVRSAKAMMLASNYDLKKAKLDFMPQLTLSGFFGLESYSIVTVSNPVWSIVTAFGMPVLNVGVAAATIDLSKAKNLEAVLNYQNTIALAIQEIRTALSDYLFNFSSIGNQKDAVRKLDDVVELNKEKFRSGLSNKIDLNSSIVAKYQVELDLIDQESNAATAYIRLQKALGIGVK
jgi:outer membrane protein TolC